MFRRLLLCCLCFGVLALTERQAVLAQDGHEHAAAQVQPSEMYKPTAMPDRIVLSWDGDLRTTQAVTWRTSVAVTNALAQITIAEAGPYFPAKATKVEATSERLKTDLGTAHYHSVSFQGLKPGTKYAYRVGDGANWSEWFHFNTASAEPAAFSFIYFGDAQNGVRDFWSRVIRGAYSDAPKAAFLLHAGDLINRANRDSEWGQWFGAGAWLNAMMPNVAIPGNHEYASDATGIRKLSRQWRPQFTFPQNGPVGLEESCYTFTYHNMRIIALNSNEQLETQAKWLEAVLAENTSQWIVCTFHHPIFSTARRRDNPELRALWKPILDKYKVDLVLQGHDHTYGRTIMKVPDSMAEHKAAAGASEGSSSVPTQTVAHVATGIQKIDEVAGTIYVVSVSGSKMYENKRLAFMKRVAEDIQLYQIIHIDGDRLRFEARTAIGELYDAFELRKRPGQVNELIEIAPEVPVNLRPSKE